MAEYERIEPHESLTLERIADAAERQMFGLDNVGLCKACGAENDGCEPDARNYRCEICGAMQVFGAEELAIEMAL